MDATVDALLKKAKDSADPVAAMNFAQAACNAANAVRASADADGIAILNKAKS